MTRSGANADDLEQGGRELSSFAGEVGRMKGELRASLHTSHWEGLSADRFRQTWDSVHVPALTDAEAFLRDASRRLNENAAEQRRASEGGGGVLTPPGSSGGDGKSGQDKDGKNGDAVDKLLKDLGLSDEDIDKLFGELGDIGGLLGLLHDLLEDGTLKTILEGVGHVFDVVSVLGDFIGDYAQHPELPFDERLVHSISETALRFAVSQGAEVAADWATKALLAAIPGGAALGFVAGPVVGYVVGQIMDKVEGAIDSKYDVYDNAGDAATDAYKYLKDHDFNPLAIADDLAGQAIDGVIDGAKDFGGAIIEVGGGVIGGASDMIGGWFK